MKMPNCNEQEKEKCKFRFSGSISTLDYYGPIYNFEGISINPDRNIETVIVECIEHNKLWRGERMVFEGDFSYRIIMGDKNDEKTTY